MSDPTALRSNFEPGTTRWAVRRAQWSAMGLTQEEQQRPKIAVVNTSSRLSVCFAHLDDVVDVVSEAVREAGGLPLEIRTTAPSDFVTSAGRKARYLMPTRDLIVNDIEAAVEGAQLDAMVLLSSCDKTTPAHLMAAARLDLPAVVVIGGYQQGGWAPRLQGHAPLPRGRRRIRIQGERLARGAVVGTVQRGPRQRAARTRALAVAEFCLSYQGPGRVRDFMAINGRRRREEAGANSAKEQAAIHASESDFEPPKRFAELETQNKTVVVLVGVYRMLSDALSDHAT
jgi:hypothetical protein